ncbi:MAG: DUF1844 domain-containing protein [Planctomycetes bacterium]|nr:DUF1844 domain-containing protein [Planctomycetota bacterium]MCB9918344.1 DUF1844 domain-containing protein [Planctomycetota bacterium]
MTDAPPPVDFRLLMASFSHQALAALGKVPHPVSGEVRVDLPWARYFIDLLGMLETKTAGNLSNEEQSALDSTLSMLRLNFVDMQRGATSSEDGAEGEAAD